MHDMFEHTIKPNCDEKGYDIKLKKKKKKEHHHTNKIIIIKNEASQKIIILSYYEMIFWKTNIIN